MFPGHVPEPEYPETRRVRSVRPQGHFRGNKFHVFLSEVLWGERVGLLARTTVGFTILFAQLPLAGFDNHKLQEVTGDAVAKAACFANVPAEGGDAFPPDPLTALNQKVSDMCSV